MAEIGEERKRGGLLKTGQTTQYGGYEDDGYFEKGLSKRYTILTARQYAGTTSITVATKTDLISNNCVYDRRTKLMWSRYASDGLGPSEDGKMPWTTDGSGHGIFPFVAAANAAKLGGYDDWRIPNANELGSLMDYSVDKNKPNATAFPDLPANPFWSSTTQHDTISCALCRYWSSEGEETNIAKTTPFSSILVRGG